MKNRVDRQVVVVIVAIVCFIDDVNGVIMTTGSMFMFMFMCTITFMRVVNIDDAAT